MATFTLKRFSNPEILKTVAPKNLIALFKPEAAYFRAQGDVAIPPPKGEELDYEGITRVLMSPQEGTPRGLVDALYFVDEMATPDAMDRLLEGIEKLPAETRRKFSLGDQPTPADVAVQAHLYAPELLQRTHAENQLTARRTFEYFQQRTDRKVTFQPPSPETLKSIGAALGDEFVKLKRGNKATVFHFPKDDGHWFLVRRGEPLKREGAVEGAQSSSVFYRPETFDVLKYDPDVGELSINTSGKRIVTVLRTTFGRYLFGDLDAFPGIGKYTLDPLRTDGEASLVCSDVEGIDQIRLIEVGFYWGGSNKEIEIRKANNVFALYKDEEKKRVFPRIPRMLWAKFSVKFTDAKTPRMVTIRPSNVASYTHDDDSGPIDEWLKRRGFINRVSDDEDHGAEPPLAAA